MIKNTILILLVAGLSSCGNSVPQEDVKGIETTGHEHTGTLAMTDPICNMEKDASWTDYEVKPEGDTVWFCSPTCKDVYTAKK